MRRMSIVAGGIVGLNVDAIVEIVREAAHADEVGRAEVFQPSKQDRRTVSCDADGQRDSSLAVAASNDGTSAKLVVRIVGPSWEGFAWPGGRKLRQAVSHVLELVVESGCESVGMPLASTGIDKDSRDNAWGEVFAACAQFLDEHPDAPLDITFALEDESLYFAALNGLADTIAAKYMELDDVQRSMLALNDDLWEIAQTYLDGPNSVYWFTFNEVAAPRETDFVAHHANPRECIYQCVDSEIFGGLGPLYGNFTEGTPSLIVDTIMLTLDRYDAQVIDLSRQGWQNFGDDAEETWMNHIGCLVRMIGQKEHWYIFWTGWSD